MNTFGTSDILESGKRLLTQREIDTTKRSCFEQFHAIPQKMEEPFILLLCFYK